MKLNHLMPKYLEIEYCKGSESGKQKHYWLSTSHINATIGKNICVRFVCKRCNKIEDVFFDHDEYWKYEKLIKNNSLMGEI